MKQQLPYRYPGLSHYHLIIFRQSGWLQKLKDNQQFANFLSFIGESWRLDCHNEHI